MFTVAPGTPKLVLKPDLLTFTFTPGKIWNVLLNLSPIYPSHTFSTLNRFPLKSHGTETST